MKGTWQMQQAKSKLSEVIGRAAAEGPQIITRHGREVAVVAGAAEYRESRPGASGLVELCREFSGVGDDLLLTRSDEVDCRHSTSRRTRV